MVFKFTYVCFCSHTKVQVGTPLGLGLGFGLVLGLGSGWDDLDDHFRWLQPIDINLHLLSITQSHHKNRMAEHKWMWQP